MITRIEFLAKPNSTSFRANELTNYTVFHYMQALGNAITLRISIAALWMQLALRAVLPVLVWLR